MSRHNMALTCKKDKKQQTLRSMANKKDVQNGSEEIHYDNLMCWWGTVSPLGDLRVVRPTMDVRLKG